MMSDKKGYKVRIFGDQYALVGDESYELVERSALLVDSLMNEIAQQSSVRDHKRIAVLAALRIASELVRAQDQIDDTVQASADLAEQIAKALST